MRLMRAHSKRIHAEAAQGQDILGRDRGVEKAEMPGQMSTKDKMKAEYLPGDGIGAHAGDSGGRHDKL